MNQNFRNIQPLNNRTVWTLTDNGFYGVCKADEAFGINPLGVAILAIVIASAVLFKSQVIIYFALALQTIGLLSLVETAWLDSLSVVLGACRYLMVFSTMGQHGKMVDGVLRSHGYFRLDDFMRNVDFNMNISAICAVTFISMAVMIAVQIVQWCINTGRFKPEASTMEFGYLMLGVFRTVYLLTIQEWFLIISSCLKYDMLSPGKTLLSSIYFLTLIYFIIVAHVNKFQYFRSLALADLTILKKIVLPTFLMTDVRQHYIIIILMLVFSGLELVLFALAGRNEEKVQPKFRSYIYRSIELGSILILGIYYAVDRSLRNPQSSLGIGIIAIIVLLVFECCLAFEVILSIIKKF